MTTQKEIDTFISEFNAENETQLTVTTTREEYCKPLSHTLTVRNKVLIELIKGDNRVATKTKSTTKKDLLETIKWFIGEHSHFVTKKESPVINVKTTQTEKIDIFSLDFLLA